jgi:hypothetical protein
MNDTRMMAVPQLYLRQTSVLPQQFANGSGTVCLAYPLYKHAGFPGMRTGDRLPQVR